MADLEISVAYLAAGANRQSAAADWGPDCTIAFGAGVNVALWRPTDSSPRGVSGLLSGHTAVVKAVKFLPSGGRDDEDSSYVISGGDDKSLRLWKIAREGAAASCVQVVSEQHGAPINCIAVAQSGSSSARRVILASGAADATIKVWVFQDGNVRLLQTIKTQPKFFPLALALSPLSHDNEDAFVLAAAGTKDFIQIFTASSSEGKDDIQFELQAKLSGHEGWIRSLDFTNDSVVAGDLLLASASQDKYVRLWRVHQGKELPTQAALDDSSSMGAFLPGKSPSNKAHWVKAAGLDYSVTFEALLFGHDDWIYSAKWHSSVVNPATPEKHTLRLLSASADNSLAIWSADPSSGIWVTDARLGELSREKGATTATGSTGGFWTGLWSPSGNQVATIGRTGSWRSWTFDSGRNFWTPTLAISGHVAPVTGISWARGGAYLLSAGSDQTTRLHAQWMTEVEAEKSTEAEGGESQSSGGTWHEMARPQIHGYDLNCIAAVGDSQFVSGADEKLMRVFREPKAVAQLLSHLCRPATSSNSTSQVNEEDRISRLPDAADMPVLGLSNKAIDATNDEDTFNPPNPHNEPSSSQPAATITLPLDHPPLEDSLSRHTLFPETEKLYGHGYEISCLAASHSGRLVASACRASSLNHAVIRLFAAPPADDPDGAWTEVRPPLAAHTLTATRLRFSADDSMLLSVGRDRQWAVFGRKEGEDDSAYEMVQANPKGHSRMILDCAWAPFAGGKQVFATAGRDKSVKIWARGVDAGGEGQKPAGFELARTVPAEHPVTAVDFLARPSAAGCLVLAVGTEAGKLSVLSLNPQDLSVWATFVVAPELCLPLSILQLAWRNSADEYGQELAIAGEDNSLRIYDFQGV